MSFMCVCRHSKWDCPAAQCCFCVDVGVFGCCSYMETEQYQEAVCDYEKIFKMDKSKGREFMAI